MIEAFRDNGLNTLDHNAEINVSRLETILSSIYYQLNKRLPTTHQINVEQSIGLLLNFMVATYDRYGSGGRYRGALDSVVHWKHGFCDCRNQIKRSCMICIHNMHILKPWFQTFLPCESKKQSYAILCLFKAIFRDPKRSNMIIFPNEKGQICLHYVHYVLSKTFC